MFDTRTTAVRNSDHTLREEKHHPSTSQAHTSTNLAAGINTLRVFMGYVDVNNKHAGLWGKISNDNNRTSQYDHLLIIFVHRKEEKNTVMTFI